MGCYVGFNIYQIQDIEQFYTYLEDLSNPLAPLFMARQRDDQSNVSGLSEIQNMRAELVTYSEDLKKWREDFIKKIQDYLIRHLNPAPHTVEYYEGLLVKLQGIDPEHSLKIITTNYDLLLDKSFNGDWIDGFVQIECGPAKTWRDKWDYDPSKPTLVKLHGSINVVDDRRHRKSKKKRDTKIPRRHVNACNVAIDAQGQGLSGRAIQGHACPVQTNNCRR